MTPVCVAEPDLAEAYLAHLAADQVRPADLLADAVGSELLSVAYQDRFLPQPVFLTATERATLATDLRTISDLLVSLPERLFDGSRSALAQAVGMTPEQTAVVEGVGDAPLTPLARADLYRTPAGFRLLEHNITSALGGFENAEINRTMLRHPALSRFVAEHGLTYVDTLRAMIDTMLAEHGVDAASGVRIALLDSPESFPTFGPRLRVMARMLAEWGLDATPAHLGQLAERNGRLLVDGRPVDAVLRYFLVEEVQTAADAALVEIVQRAAHTGAVVLTSRLDAELYGNKGALALLSDDRHRAAFTAGERACIDRVVPWTRPLRGAGTDPDGERVDLARYAHAHREELILKPTNRHGGSGIVAGWTVGAEEWARAVAAALDRPFVLQHRVRPMPEPFAEESGREELVLNWGVFLVDPAAAGTPDGYGGCIVRGTRDRDVGVVSMGTGARVGCCFTG